jgi:hypothetical protein
VRFVEASACWSDRMADRQGEQAWISASAAASTAPAILIAGRGGYEDG